MDKVLVPVQLTDEMRERMGHLADGPDRTHDEVWSEMLDAAYTPPRPQEESIWMDLRRTRATQLTGHIMNIVGKHICEHDGRDNRRRVADELFDLLYKAGAEIISDERRAEAGLPPRDLKGWTREELAAMEARRLETMLSPVPPVIIPTPHRS
jgi:hypothetical protein